jgi:hypothetical protein
VEVLKALREIQEHLEMEETKVQLVQKAHKELQALLVQLAHQVLVVHKVQQEVLVVEELQVLQVL